MSEQDADNFPLCISVCSRHGRFLGLLCDKCRTITSAIVVERWPEKRV